MKKLHSMTSTTYGASAAMEQARAEAAAVISSLDPATMKKLEGVAKTYGNNRRAQRMTAAIVRRATRARIRAAHRDNARAALRLVHLDRQARRVSRLGRPLPGMTDARFEELLAHISSLNDGARRP